MAQRILAGLALALVFGGCAFTVDTVPLQYRPRAPASALPGASNVLVVVLVNDARKVADRKHVSVKKNGYGVEMADIRSQNDVPELVRSALWHELRQRGFTYRTGGVKVVAELRRFYNDFKTGFFSGAAVAEVTLDVSVFPYNGTPSTMPLFTAHIEGEGRNDGIGLCSGENAGVALERALTDAMATLFTDARFLGTLTSSSSPPAEPPAPTAPTAADQTRV